MNLVCDAYCTLGFDRDEAQTAEELRVKMDAAEVDLALVAPSSRELAVDNRAGNRRIAEAAATSDGRWVAGISVNPWFTDALASAEEARQSGGQVLILAPHRQGYLLGAPLGDELVAWAVDHRLPIYAHAAPTSSGTPTQLMLLAERFPEGRFLLGRGGTSDYASDLPPLLAQRMPNLWFDTGFVRPGALAAYAQAAPDRLCFASCSPQNDLALERQLLTEAVPEPLRVPILGSNFLRFLGRL